MLNLTARPSIDDVGLECDHIYMAQQGCEPSLILLVECHLRRISSIARRYAWDGIDSDDLIMAGVSELIKVIHEHSLDRSLWASGYHRVTHAVSVDAFNNGGLIQVPIATRRKLAGKMTSNLSEHAEAAALAALGRYETLSGTDDDETGIGANLSLVSPVLTAATERVVELADDALEACGNDRDREVLKLTSGFYGEPLTDQQVADRLGVSRAMAQKIRTRALERARKALA